MNTCITEPVGKLLLFFRGPCIQGQITCPSKLQAGSIYYGLHIIWRFLLRKELAISASLTTVSRPGNVRLAPILIPEHVSRPTLCSAVTVWKRIEWLIKVFNRYFETAKCITFKRNNIMSFIYETSTYVVK